jgi:sodium-dependent dicarboxylate transporter 2/3/5
MTKTQNRFLGITISLAIALLLYFINPFNLSGKAASLLPIAACIISLWITDAFPMPVVALLPIVLFPLLGISSIEAAAAPYADKIIFLFLGGFMLGLAIEKWQLHKRIALNIVRLTGTSGNKIILGFILATGLLSMWLSNTATTMMMFPIASSVILVMQQGDIGKGNVKYFSVCMMLAIAYASNFGGIATIIGTPPNVAYVGQVQQYYGYSFGFGDWMLLCLPISILLLLSLYFLMTKFLYPNHILATPETKAVIDDEITKLGKITSAEKRVLIVFTATALMWIFKDLLNGILPIKLDDSIIALIGAIALFIFPSGDKDEPLLVWKDTQKMAWGILILFGGGISLAAQLEKAGLIGQLGNWIAQYAGSNLLLLVFLITLISIFLSEVMSNVAQVIVFAPVIAGIADAMHVNPLLLGMPMTLGASCASMLPMGTPPNAIVFGSGHLKLKDMIKTGFAMNIISVILITVFCYYLLPLLVPAITPR